MEDGGNTRTVNVQDHALQELMRITTVEAHPTSLAVAKDLLRRFDAAFATVKSSGEGDLLQAETKIRKKPSSSLLILEKDNQQARLEGFIKGLAPFRERLVKEITEMEEAAKRASSAPQQPVVHEGASYTRYGLTSGGMIYEILIAESKTVSVRKWNSMKPPEGFNKFEKAMGEWDWGARSDPAIGADLEANGPIWAGDTKQGFQGVWSKYCYEYSNSLDNIGVHRPAFYRVIGKVPGQPTPAERLSTKTDPPVLKADQEVIAIGNIRLVKADATYQQTIAYVNNAEEGRRGVTSEDIEKLSVGDHFILKHFLSEHRYKRDDGSEKTCPAWFWLADKPIFSMGHAFLKLAWCDDKGWFEADEANWQKTAKWVAYIETKPSNTTPKAWGVSTAEYTEVGGIRISPKQISQAKALEIEKKMPGWHMTDLQEALVEEARNSAVPRATILTRDTESNLDGPHIRSGGTLTPYSKEWKKLSKEREDIISRRANVKQESEEWQKLEAEEERVEHAMNSIMSSYHALPGAPYATRAWGHPGKGTVSISQNPDSADGIDIYTGISTDGWAIWVPDKPKPKRLLRKK